MFLFFSFLFSHFGACTGFAWATRDWLKWTIAFKQIYSQLEFPAGEARKVTPGHPSGWIWFVQCPVLIYLAARWFRPFWIISFEFVNVCWIRFSSWESFIGFYIWCYPISTILACSFTVLVRIYMSQSSRKFDWALRTTTNNWRVSFIELYLAFPTYFRIVFLPPYKHCNFTRIVLW